GVDSARLSAQQEVENLLADRDKLEADLELLRGRIDEQREQLRSGLGQLQRLLDDPTVLAPVPPPTLSDVQRPAPLESPNPPEPVPAPAPAPVAADAPQPDGTNGRGPLDMGPPPFPP